MASEKRVVRKGVRVEAGAEGGGRSERERPERVRRVLFGDGGAGMVMVGGGKGGGKGGGCVKVVGYFFCDLKD